MEDKTKELFQYDKLPKWEKRIVEKMKKWEMVVINKIIKGEIK